MNKDCFLQAYQNEISFLPNNLEIVQVIDSKEGKAVE